MRTIKFRAKDIENGQPWRYGSLVTNLDSVTIISFDGGGEEHSYDVDPDTVGQFIGLKDKNGRGIYEGDIVQIRYITKDGKCVVFPNKYSIIWIDKETAFSLYDGFSNCGSIVDSTKVEVIGNIHDNPELLKGGSNGN